MTISYTEAHNIPQYVAANKSVAFADASEIVPLDQALGGTVKDDNFSPIATPTFDTSAMDGYAVNSDLTAHASRETLVLLCVKGTMAAGDAPISVSSEVVHVLVPCIEIMTGAQFPQSLSDRPFDAVIPVEHTIPLSSKEGDCHIVQIVKPANKDQHRRFAGSIVQKGDLIISKRSTIASQHIMAFASLGIGEVAVLRKIRVGIWSTGAEVASIANGVATKNKIPDVNGPYLTAALRELGADVSFLGVVVDDAEALAQEIRRELAARNYDLMITTGAVSADKYDFVRGTMEKLDAKLHFHHVAMRPGHPVLCASLPAQTRDSFNDNLKMLRDTTFFGLPGNPIASAACFWFLVAPYINKIIGKSAENGVMATAVAAKSQKTLGRHSEMAIPSPLYLDAFRHGISRPSECGLEVEISQEQSPAKMKPFVMANCWFHIPQDHGDLREGDVVECFPLDSGSVLNVGLVI